METSNFRSKAQDLINAIDKEIAKVDKEGINGAYDDAYADALYDASVALNDLIRFW